MPLASGADIKLDDDEFMIDRAVPRHYVHRFRNLVPQRSEIMGMPGKETLFSDTLMWTYDDWAGGEGNRQWYPDEFDVYNVGYELNPRIRGQLTGRPNRVRASVAATDVRNRVGLAVGDRRPWMWGGHDLFYYNTSTETMTASTESDVFPAPLSDNYNITAATGDEKYLYFAAWHSASSGTRVIRRIENGGADATVRDEETGALAFIGLAVSNGKLYAWTGRKLYELDIDQSMPLASDKMRKVYDTGAEVSTASAQNQHYWGECIATESGVVVWFSTDGQTDVYEYKRGVGRPMWRAPYGFTVKGSCYQNGVVYLAGHWGGDSVQTGEGALYAIRLSDYEVMPLKHPRSIQGTNLQIQTLANSYGSQILCVGEHSGRIFVYDADSDGFTMLDDFADAATNADSLKFARNNGETGDNRVGGALTWGTKRLVAIWCPQAAAADSEEYQLVTYDDERLTNRETGLNATNYTGLTGYFESPLWDYNFPMERKNLVGFHLNFDPLVSGMFIDVSYSIDGASYTNLTQVTSSTSGASTGRVFIPVSTSSATVSFFQMSFRVKLTSSTGVYTPILYAVSCEAKLKRLREEWELVIRLKDEEYLSRPANREVRGSRLRDWLEATVESGAVVALQDGYRYGKQGPQVQPNITTHTVIIQEVEDVIEKAGEGSCRVLLVATTEAT